MRVRYLVSQIGKGAALCVALFACTPVEEDRVFAPTGVAQDEESVDGLVVGHRLMAAGLFELALDAYVRAAAEQGLTVDVLSAMGSANLRLGRLGQAENQLRAAIRLDETFVPAWNNLGVVLFEQGRFAEAERVFRTAFALDSGASVAIRDNLRAAISKSGDVNYGSQNATNFKLIRRGAGDFVLLSTP